MWWCTSEMRLGGFFGGTLVVSRFAWRECCGSELKRPCLFLRCSGSSRRETRQVCLIQFVTDAVGALDERDSLPQVHINSFPTYIVYKQFPHVHINIDDP